MRSMRDMRDMIIITDNEMNDGLSTTRKYSSHRLLDNFNIIPDSLNSWDAIATKKGKIQHKIKLPYF